MKSVTLFDDAEDIVVPKALQSNTRFTQRVDSTDTEFYKRLCIPHNCLFLNLQFPASKRT